MIGHAIIEGTGFYGIPGLEKGEGRTIDMKHGEISVSRRAVHGKCVVLWIRSTQ
jgi:hypothetical protein